MTYQQRERFYDKARMLTPYLAADAGGAVFLVRTEDRNVSRSLFNKQGRVEMEVLARAVAVVTEAAGRDAVEGRQFLDVGANIGTTTIPALLQHHFGSAVAFEPEPQNVLTLRLNLLLNGLEERGVAQGVAVSDRDGTSELVVNLEQGGKHWIAADDERLALRADGTSVIEVETVTLDRMVERGVVEADRVGMLWIDAQAHEGHILEGAGKLVERGVPLVLEWDPRGLDKLGHRIAIEDVVQEHYTHFVDLRPNDETENPAFESRPAEALGDYASPFFESSGRTMTDILAIRLGDEQADALDVTGLLTRHRALKGERASELRPPPSNGRRGRSRKRPRSKTATKASNEAAAKRKSRARKAKAKQRREAAKGSAGTEGRDGKPAKGTRDRKPAKGNKARAGKRGAKTKAGGNS